MTNLFDEGTDLTCFGCGMALEAQGECPYCDVPFDDEDDELDDLSYEACCD